jgi:hypothetical protein
MTNPFSEDQREKLCAYNMNYEPETEDATIRVFPPEGFVPNLSEVSAFKTTW